VRRPRRPPQLAAVRGGWACKTNGMSVDNRLERFRADFIALLHTPFAGGTLGGALKPSKQMEVVKEGKRGRATYPAWNDARLIVRPWLLAHTADLDLILEMARRERGAGVRHTPAHVTPWLLWLALCVFIRDPARAKRDPAYAKLIIDWLTRYVFRRVTWGDHIQKALGHGVRREGSFSARYLSGLSLIHI